MPCAIRNCSKYFSDSDVAFIYEYGKLNHPPLKNAFIKIMDIKEDIVKTMWYVEQNSIKTGIIREKNNFWEDPYFFIRKII